MLFSLLSISRSHERPFDGESDRRSYDFGMSAGGWGMTVFLASLGMLFGGGLVGLLAIRGGYPAWPPPGLPMPHLGFLIATALLLSVSAALYAASRAVRAERITRTKRLLMLSFLLASGFVALQGWNWSLYLEQINPALAWRIAGYLYFFAALHALHVMGGLVPLLLVLLAFHRRRLVAERCRLIPFTAAYWHLLDAVWIAAILALVIPG
jgi:cytochrome c oxidase subunit 3